MHMIRAFLLAALLFAPALATSAAAADAARVELFSPQGTIKGIRQATARFTSPMVALGDPRMADPFTIDCPAPGRGRWADMKTWVYDFDGDLAAGLRCSFTLKPEVRDAAGRSVGGTSRFSFDTGGPSVIASLPRRGDRAIDENQVFLLALDGAVTPQSVAANAACAVAGLPELIPLDVLDGAARAAVLAERRKLGYRYADLLAEMGNAGKDRADGKKAEDLIIAVKCRRTLPPETTVRLIWGKGITAPGGIATVQDQSLEFRTRPGFAARFECERVNADAGCLPMKDMRVVFTAPVPREGALAVTLQDAGGKSLKPTADQTDKSPYVSSITFRGPFPEQHGFSVVIPAGLTDDAGRPLENRARFPLSVATDAYPPLVKFAGSFGILEAKEGGILPVTLRNVETEALPAVAGKRLKVTQSDAAIATWLRRTEEAERPTGEWREDKASKRSYWYEMTGSSAILANEKSAEAITVPKREGARAFEVVGIPLTAPGFYVVELASPRLGAALLGRNEPRHVATSALVTNMAVHFQWGREASQVWVTSLDAGTPVAGAAIAISNACDGRVLWRGQSDAQGIARLGDSLPEPTGWQDCGGDPRYAPLMVSARKDGDLSFTLSNWQNGIAPGNFGLATGSQWQADIVHSVLDRALFRAGETLSMKHFLRRHVMNGFALPPSFPRKSRVRIAHLGSDSKVEMEIGFDGNGVAESTWAIPADAKLGDYAVSIEIGKDNWIDSGRFRVEQFRIPTMRAVVQGPAEPLINARDTQLDLFVSYLAGGGASGSPVKLRTMVEPRRLAFPGYDDYQFGGKMVREGIFSSSDEGEADQDRSSGAKMRVMPLTLDKEGTARASVADLPALDEPAQLLAELEYEDANGEILTAANRIPLWTSGITLGIRTEGWTAAKDQVRFRIVALDLRGKPVAGQAVRVELYSQISYSYRKRLIGGFYAYENTREIKKIKADCKGKTDRQGLFLCDITPGVSGEVILLARAEDGKGNPAIARASVWMAGDRDWWFEGNDGDRMDLLPEQREYETGDRARLQVRMPFRSATALVTVMREGVVDSFVTRLSGRKPVIDLPIKDSYSPNVYVSVLAVRGRVASSTTRSGRGSDDITAMVDLAKPAYKFGMAELKVGWKPHRLDVRVTPERSTYKIRERARVTIRVARANGQPLPAGTELAIAAVDEGLLELAPNPSSDLLSAMMGKRGLEVWTSTAQMQVVGKRHYGRKAVPFGGGGGRDRAREMFDSLLLWQGRVTVDANGQAVVEVPLNDSLSSFRIVAVAHGGLGLFGTGQASIATTQDLMLHAGLPPLVREGDRYAATVTLRNSTDAPMTVTATARTTPSVGTLAPQTIDIPAGAARDVVWTVTAPQDATRIDWDVTASDTSGKARDHVAIHQDVTAAYPVRVYQATIAQLEKPLDITVARPAGAIAGRGGIAVALHARLGDGMEGVADYMRRYPYSCFEQRASVAVALGDKERWTTLMTNAASYQDRDGLLKYFPSSRLMGSDVLTAYVLSLGAEAGWSIPAGPRTAMIAGLTNFVTGRIQRASDFETPDLAIRKIAAIEALARHKAAEPRMLASIRIEPTLWPTSAVLDWISILRTMPDVPQRDKRLAEAKQIIRARLNFQGTTMSFSTARSDALWWLMVSGDTNGVRALLALRDEPDWQADMPRLARGALGRQMRGHWDTTTANAWGTLAMKAFSARFEKVPVSGRTLATLGPRTETAQWNSKDKTGRNEIALPDFTLDTRPQKLVLRHEGTGKPWAIVQSRAALPLREPFSSGYRITRRITPVEQQVTGVWSRGDVMRVTLDLEAQSDMTWVVVDDPIPAGSAILGGGLARDSALMSRSEQRTDWSAPAAPMPAFEERRFDGYRAYYRHVPKGRWTVDYTLRLNNPGSFQMPATRVEALYAPEMLGESPNAPIVVEPARATAGPNR